MPRFSGFRHVALTVALLFGTAACGTGATEPVGTGPTSSGQGADWMTSVFVDHRDVTLGQMLIPGTHDSGTSAIDVTPPCEHSFNYGESKLSQLGGAVRPCMVSGMARTQTQSLGDQLSGGIRYLDLRIGVPEEKAATEAKLPTAAAENLVDVPLVLQHVLVAEPLVSGLDQIIKFTAQHPREQVILDLQRLDLPNSSPAVLDHYIHSLDELLQDYVPPGVPNARSICKSAWSRDVIATPDRDLSRKVSIGQAWAANRNLIVLVDPGQLPDRPCYRNRQEALLSPWPNTESPTVSVDANQKELQQRQEHLAAAPSGCSGGDKQNWCGFFVNQMQLSINPGTQKKCVAVPNNECSLFACSQLVNNEISGHVKQWRKSDSLPVNIVIADYYNYSDPQIADTMISLNRELLSR
jgi:hypothetical protein